MHPLPPSPSCIKAEPSLAVPSSPKMVPRPDPLMNGERIAEEELQEFDSLATELDTWLSNKLVEFRLVKLQNDQVSFELS